MPFDTEGIFHDGTTITADITPTSETRSSGSAVLKLLETAAKGLSAIMIVRADLAEAADTIQVTIEQSDAVGGTYVEIARFPLLTKGTGMPGTYIIRFASMRDPVTVNQSDFFRAKIDITDADAGADFSVANLFIFIAPAPFKVL